MEDLVKFMENDGKVGNEEPKEGEEPSPDVEEGEGTEGEGEEGEGVEGEGEEGADGTETEATDATKDEL